MKKLVSLLLALLLCACTGCSPSLKTVLNSYVGIAAHIPKETEPIAHTSLSFSDLPDEVPNVKLEIERMKELRFRIERGELTGTQAKAQLDRREQAYREIETAAALSYVRYCADVTDAKRKEAYDLLSVETDTLYALLVETHLLLSKDPTLSEVYDAETVEELKRADSLYSPSIDSLRKEERTLVGAYEAAAQGFTVEMYGRSWTKEQILTDSTLSYESLIPLYEAYMNAYNKEAGTIFLKLIDVRNRIAQSFGYPSYVEYAYALYDRDYTPLDTQALAERIQKRIVLLFTEMQDQIFSAQMRLSCGTFSEAATMERIRDAITTMLPELSEPWTYMTSHGMIDVSASEHRMAGSFTTYFASYEAPFLFSTWDDSYSMVSTLLHEFGHYASYYRNGEAASASLDLCEVDSQGMELLAVSEYDRLYGALADAARTANLFYALYVLLSGSMEDAFQQYAYRTEHVTTEQLNAEYGRLCDAYGLSDLGLDAYAWTEIPHTFQSPLYYVSYCTGMLTAWQLLVLSKRDRAAALDAYRSILDRKNGESFREVVRGAGLDDPFDADAFRKLTDAMERIIHESDTKG